MIRTELTANVLVASDDAETLAAVAKSLEKAGFEPILATGGEQALRAALREKLSAVVLDLGASEVDGYEVARHLAEISRTRAVPSLLVARTRIDAAAQHRAYDLGVVDVLVRPLDPDLLTRKIAAWVRVVREREIARDRALGRLDAERRASDRHLAELRTAMLDGLPASQRLLLDIGDILDCLNTDRTTLARLAARLVPELGDWCLVDEFVGRAAVRSLGAAHVDPDRQEWLRGMASQRGLDPHARVGIGNLRRSARSELHADVRDAARLATVLAVDPASIELLRAIGGGSCLLVPVAARGRVLGAMSFVSARRPFQKPDVVLAEEVSHRVASAMELASRSEEARRAVDARDQLLAVISHDLRNPLSSVLGCAEMIESIPSEDPAFGRVRRATRIIVQAATRMERITSDLLDFAHLREGRLVLSRAPVPALSLLEETAARYRADAEEKEVRLGVIEKDPAIVECDRGRILQVLANLVENALKFTPRDGSIELRVEASQREAVFHVADTGAGIAREDLTRIFERALAGRGPRSGIGFGLAIVKGVVELHGGRVWLDSELGVGTTFHFTLPLAEGAPNPR